jgi:hypothetical protein
MNASCTSQEFFKHQGEFLSRIESLRTLFDKFEAQPCFTIPEHEVTINPDNVTLSPEQYNIFLSQLEMSNMRIIYYCLLYYIFERNPENKGFEMYERLMDFIYSHRFHIRHGDFVIEEG